MLVLCLKSHDKEWTSSLSINEKCMCTTWQLRSELRHSNTTRSTHKVKRRTMTFKSCSLIVIKWMRLFRTTYNERIWIRAEALTRLIGSMMNSLCNSEFKRICMSVTKRSHGIRGHHDWLIFLVINPTSSSHLDWGEIGQITNWHWAWLKWDDTL